MNLPIIHNGTTAFKSGIQGYFPNIDESESVQDESGTTVISKQKVLNADFIGKDLPFDFDLGNLELKLNDNVNINTATRTVVRDRVSYCLETSDMTSRS